MPSMHRLRYRELFRALMFLAVATSGSLLPQAALAQSSQQPITVVTPEHLHSEVLNEDRVVDVYVPPSCTVGNARYPVLYLLDGEAHLEHTVGLTRFLADAGRVPELIVVSLHNIDLVRFTARAWIGSGHIGRHIGAKRAPAGWMSCEQSVTRSGNSPRPPSRRLVRQGTEPISFPEVEDEALGLRPWPSAIRRTPTTSQR
jgi:hypothetical protein